MSVPLDLSHIWVDRARVVKRETVGIVEGEPEVANTYGGWFSCRIPPLSSSEVDKQGHGEIDDTREFTARITPDSDLLEESDMLEVESEGISQMWRVDRVWRPRNGVGQRLLVVGSISRRDEF